MALPLASTHRARIKHHRRRKISSGRRDYNYFRDYDPATGRYIESDPIGLAGGLSTYAYAESNSVRRSDPLGLFDVVAVPTIYTATEPMVHLSFYGPTSGFFRDIRDTVASSILSSPLPQGKIAKITEFMRQLQQPTGVSDLPFGWPSRTARKECDGLDAKAEDIFHKMFGPTAPEDRAISQDDFRRYMSALFSADPNFKKYYDVNSMIKRINGRPLGARD